MFGPKRPNYNPSNKRVREPDPEASLHCLFHGARRVVLLLLCKGGYQ